jgi:Zn-dependent peptidase ImmA (M78 family)
MSEVDLGMIEEGAKSVSLARLQNMAEKYDRPVVALLLQEVPQINDQLPDFRTAPDRQGSAWSPALHKAYRRVLGQRTIMLELIYRSEARFPTVDFYLPLGGDAESAGNAIREWLGSHRTEPANDANEALRNWAAQVESKGVLVTQVSGVDVDEMRGFSISERPIPVISLNGADTIRGRNFTLFHELTHVLLSRSSLCDLDDSQPMSIDGNEAVEFFCNAVSAAFLMPQSEFLGDPVVAKASPSRRWSDDDLSHLANRFHVSEEAVLRRLVTLNKTSWDYYRERRSHYLSLYRNRKKQSGGPGHYVMTIRNLGKRYVETVWNAYERGDIGDPQVSRYLQTSFEHVPTLIEKAGLA